MNYQPVRLHQKSGLAVLLSAFLIAAPLAGQDRSALIELNPPNATPNDTITYKLSGAWPNGCVPQSPQVSISPASIRIETSNPNMICTQAVTPWTLAGSIGKLATGEHQLTVTFSGPSGPPVEIGRKAFSVTDSSAVNEFVLPIVVNGAVADKIHYQTIFTILNASTQDIRATLQIHDNAGKPRGVFCSSLAPPPSSVTATLNPNQELFRFTSADLPFLNGWASLRWEGPSSVLAGVELTLIAAAPSPCLLVCNRPSTEKLSSAMIPAIKPAREFRFPATINRNRQTALALVNPSATDPVIVRVSLLNASGENADLGVANTFEVRIPPLERICNFLWQLALEHSPTVAVVPVPEMFQGSVLLTADAPFAVGALNIMFPEGKFVTIPTFSPLP